MNTLAQFIKLKEDSGASAGFAGGGAVINGGTSATNTIGDGNGAVKLYAPPLSKKIAKHGVLEGLTVDPTDDEYNTPYVKIPTSLDTPEEDEFKFHQIQQKINTVGG